MLIACSAYAQQAETVADHYNAYLTSWGLNEPAALNNTQADSLTLAFAKWDPNGVIETSDNIATAPEYNEYWLPSGYTAWTDFKLEHPNKKIFIAFGGQTYEDMWSSIETDEQREKVANNLIALRSKKFPVYKKGLNEKEIVGECLSFNWDGSCNTSNYQLAGYVTIDGFDFDFEKSARITAKDNDNLLKLIQLLRNKQTEKTILTLTTYHVGADSPSCSNNDVVEGCSFIGNKRSAHNGEVIGLLEKSAGLFDRFNVMAYDAGHNLRWGVAMANYAKAVGDASKIVLGVTINAQWAPEGNFVESKENNMNRAKWQAANGYGGLFIWNFGSNTTQMPMDQQVQYFNEMIDAAKRNLSVGYSNFSAQND